MYVNVEFTYFCNSFTIVRYVPLFFEIAPFFLEEQKGNFRAGTSVLFICDNNESSNSEKQIRTQFIKWCIENHKDFLTK